jgi:hypothetical protein
MSSIQPFVWRHFCVDNTDITSFIDIRKGGYITIPLHYRIQTIFPVNPVNLVLQGLQGGFLCTHDAVTYPTQGILQYTGKGWFYVPNIDAHAITPTISNPTPFDDSFTFTLSNMGQYSPPQTVQIKFI